MTPTIDFGIDLGTTNSSIAYCRDGKVQVFPNEARTTVTPSVVYIGANGRMLVGHKAYDIWAQDAQNTQAEFKRWMGLNDTLHFPAADRQLSAEELSAQVLKSLIADAARQAQPEITAAVITVPAAFGSLQCDATRRAARLAGLQESPLLQEPIAAAIAYGATPGSQNQRWMIFDLGGGTLDIAVISTRNGRLAVLEHQGNNRLGGKDLDRVIAERLLFPPLASTFALPDPKQQTQAYDRLLRALVRHAELAKIALSNAEQVTIEFFDLGKDIDGKPIELALELTRAQVEAVVEPLVETCIELAVRAMEGARTAHADLDRILLVGGPTQMPIVRAALSSRIGARLDASLDPMTVVAHGAALYASTIEHTSSSQSAATAVPAGVLSIQLAYERASGTSQSPVAGVLPEGSAAVQIKLDTDSGEWTSGWIEIVDGCFELDVTLSEAKPVTQFLITARDKVGHILPVEPSCFSITRMLPMTATPLPHTIAIELSTLHGVSQFDSVFRRHTPLPAKTSKTYRTDRTLRPSELGATLPIKFWEIQVSDDPQEKWYAGAIHIHAEAIKRPILEGSDIELQIEIDTSRRMTVEVFVPILNQSFSDGVYVPDPPSARSHIQQELDLCFERLSHARELIYELDRADLRDRANALQLFTESVFEQVAERERRGGADPDAQLGASDALRKIRAQLVQIEEQLEAGSGPMTLSRKVRLEARWTDQVVSQHGTEADKAEFCRLQDQLAKYDQAEDARGIRWVQDQMRQLRGAILDFQPWFWLNVLAFLKRPGRRFNNREQAQFWLNKAEAAEQMKDLPALRDALNRVWAMQPPEQVEMAKEQATQSGLRSL